MDHALLPAGPNTAIVASLLLTGLIGGIGHCAAMCGPFVLSQLDDAPQGRMLRRLSGWLLLPFQLGRAVTYSLLGAGAGAAGSGLLNVVEFRWSVAALLALAALLLLLQGLRRLKPSLRLGAAVARLAAPLGRRSSFAFGMVLGLLPCGFLYAALAAAAATGSAIDGAAAMAAFALGTSASLVAIGLAGRTAALRWRGLAARLAGPVFIANAAMVASLALKAALLA